ARSVPGGGELTNPWPLARLLSTSTRATPLRNGLVLQFLPACRVRDHFTSWRRDVGTGIDFPFDSDAWRIDNLASLGPDYHGNDWRFRFPTNFRNSRSRNGRLRGASLVRTDRWPS